MKKVFACLCLIFLVAQAFGQPSKEKWVDSVFNSMSQEEKIGQLFMPKVSSLTSENTELLLEYIKQHRIGGIVVTQGGPVSHVTALKKLQAKSKIPLFVGLNSAVQEYPGLLDSVLTFPPPLALSAIRNDSLLAEWGKEVAAQLKLLGIQLYFGPNADIHMGNKVYPATLHYFGETKKRVASKTVAFVSGMQKNGVLAVVTHPAVDFPEMNGLSEKPDAIQPIWPDSVQFYPYQELLLHGVGGILTSNLRFNSAIDRKNSSRSVQQLYLSELIKKKLGYQGLVFTDVPVLQNWVEKPRGGETEALAIQVGNDILIDPQNLSATIKSIKKLLKGNTKLKNQLDVTVKKILSTKYETCLFRAPALNTDNLILKLNSTASQVSNRKLVQQSITVVSNENDLLPIKALDKKFAFVSVGLEKENAFSKTLAKYAPFDLFEIRTAGDTSQLLARLKKYEVVVTGIFPLANTLIAAVLPHLYPLRSSHLVVCHFGDPKQLLAFNDFATVVEAYVNTSVAQSLSAQIVFGAVAAEGQLPVTVSPTRTEGHGITLTAINRLSYGLPEEVGMDSRVLKQIERIAREAIDSGATPGCHVLVARKGKVIYDRSFGWQTYENKIPVTDQTIYDLASVTKVSATLQTIQFLYEKGMIDLDKKASVYLPELKNSNKKDFTIRDILTHQAGLWPFLPFWTETMKKSVHMPEYYSFGESDYYPFPVSNNLFATVAMKDSLWSWIVHSKIRPKVNRTPYDYRYSDMGFYIFQHLAEKLLNQPMEDFLEQNLYEPLGAYSLGYLPLTRFPAEQIAPTENDTIFRKSLLRGYVHDQGAAMHGGIAGHAGLFGTATDMAKLGQMLLNKGSYGGASFFKPETIELFTSRQFETSRRGLGWDKPTISDWNGPTSMYSSTKTFGHTGFTGTCVWVDPEFDLVYVFLSNRVHPSMTNNKLLTANIRPRIQEVVYKSIFNYSQYSQ